MKTYLPEPYDELMNAVARVHQTMLADAREIKVLREQLTDMSLKLREANDRLIELAKNVDLREEAIVDKTRESIAKINARNIEEHAKLNLSSLDMQRF